MGYGVGGGERPAGNEITLLLLWYYYSTPLLVPKSQKRNILALPNIPSLRSEVKHVAPSIPAGICVKGWVSAKPVSWRELTSTYRAHISPFNRKPESRSDYSAPHTQRKEAFSSQNRPNKRSRWDAFRVCCLSKRWSDCLGVCLRPHYWCDIKLLAV